VVNMSSSGSSVHKKIKVKIKEVESDSEALASSLYQMEQQLSNLTLERENCYSSLATHYLPELDAQSVQTTLREVRESVQKVFAVKQERRSSLEKLMKENREADSKLEEEIDRVTEQIEYQAQERDKTVGLISAELEKNIDYSARDKDAKKAEVRLKQYKQRVEEVRLESEKKLPSFEQNKIFSYLLKIGFKTSNYTGSSLTENLDSWAAKKVNFEENKKCYDFLKSMPELMKLEVERRQEELDKVVAEMEEIESITEKKYGLPEIVEKAEKLLSQRQTLIERDKKQDEEYSLYIKEREEIDSKKDPYHVQAVQQIKNYLKGEQIADLKTRARQTSGTEDDKLVDRVDQIDLEIRKIKDRAIYIKKERDTLSEKLDGLREVEKRFRSNDYEGSYSYFPSDFDINMLILAYMSGKFTTSDVNDEIDSSQHTRTPTYHSSSNYSSSHSSSSSSSSGFGSFGSFSSGGGIGGGGFSSGKGF